MDKVTITIGTAKAVAQLGADKVAEIANHWSEQVTLITGGCSRYTVTGSYLMDDGTLVTEESLVFYTLTEHPEHIAKLHDFARNTCHAWGEECVLFTVEEQKSVSFVS